MTGPRVVCIGIATLDAIALVDRLPLPGERRQAGEARLAGGGVVATASVALSRLGVPTAMVGRVADDAAGRLIVDGLREEGVDVSCLRIVEGRTPVSLILVESGSGERSIVPDVRGVPPLEAGPDVVELARQADWVHVDQTGHSVVTHLRAAGVSTPVSFDGGNTTRHLTLDGVDLYAPTEQALLARHPGSLETAIRAALDEGPRMVVATRGAAGSAGAVATPGGHPAIITEPAASGIEVVSTLGAGDVFHGALLAALIEGQPLAGALRWANAAALLACRALDGRSASPGRSELEMFLAGTVARGD